MRRLFIDPASKSAGWAVFDEQTLVGGGTVKAKGKDQFLRLVDIADGFAEVFERFAPNEVHIEKLNYGVHYACLWSVGVIGSTLAALGCKVEQDVTVSSWQAHCNWKSLKLHWEAHGFDSEDAMAAESMGRWWLEVNASAGKKED